MSTRVAPVIALALAIACLAVALACSVVLLLDFAARGKSPSFFEVAALLVAAAYGSIGGLVAVRRPANALGWLLLTIAAVTVLTETADLMAVRRAFGWQVEGWLQTWTFFLVYPVGFSIVLVLFPVGKVPSPRWGWVPAALLLAQLPRLFVAAFAAGPITGHMSGAEILPLNPLMLLSADFMNWGTGSITVALSWALPGLGVAAAAISLVSRWRSAKADARQQLKWLGLIGVLSAFAFALHFATTVGFGTGVVDVGGFALVALLALGIPMAVALAAVKYRLYDVDLLINRTIVYGLVTAALVGLYAVILGAVDALLHQRLTLFASLASTAVVAIVFAPLRAQIQRGVDTLLFGTRPDPYEALAEVSVGIVEGEGERRLLDEVAAAIARSIGVSYCAVTAQGADGKTVALGSFGEPAVNVVTMPLRYRGQAVGRMSLGPGPERPRRNWPRRLIVDLAGQAAVAAHSAIQSAELERSRSRVVAVRDEERRRLRRDLHDGLGPALAAQTLKAGAARMVLASDPDRAVQLLQEIERDGQATMAEVRRLVHALRPPALDELGLAGALRQVASSLSGPRMRVVLDLPDQLPPLNAVVEAATLRIAQEALANVQRHANAAECILTLAVNGELRLTVEDDGVGLEPGRLGVGVASIKERAAELGGVATVVSRSSSGTIVDVHIPLATDATRG